MENIKSFLAQRGYIPKKGEKNWYGKSKEPLNDL